MSALLFLGCVAAIFLLILAMEGDSELGATFTQLHILRGASREAEERFQVTSSNVCGGSVLTADASAIVIPSGCRPAPPTTPTANIGGGGGASGAWSPGRYGREILRDHHLSAATWAEAETRFTRQGALEIAAIIGDYALAAVLLHAVDQRLPVDMEPLLPEKKPD